MALVVLVLVVLFGLAALVEVSAKQPRSQLSLSVPALTADAPKRCCRICRKSKPRGDGCISEIKQCKKGQDCACAAESDSSH